MKGNNRENRMRKNDMESILEMMENLFPYRSMRKKNKKENFT